MNILSDQEDSDNAKNFIKRNERLIIEKFASLENFPPRENPFSIFMAGSPGAGKTEFSKALIESSEPDSPLYAVRIDADEIKNIIPQYKGNNSDVIQGAASLGVEKLYDYVLKNNQNVIVDGTFANYEIACRNIQRSIGKRRIVSIFYIYQDPLVAWDFTQKREKLEGRYIPKEAFIYSFFAAKKNVEKIKSEFKDKVMLFLIKKNDIDNSIEKFWVNIDSIDNYIKIKYTIDSLRSRL